MKKAVVVAAIVLSLGLAAMPGHAATTSIVVAGFQYVPSGYVTANPLGLAGVPGPQAIAPTTPAVRAGDALSFTSLDPVPHTVTKLTGPWPTSVTERNLSAGSTANLSLAGFPTGTYTYFCRIHAGMRGGFVVTS